MKIAVVGAGIMGANAARFLALRGHAVTVYEQFPLLHTLGSSHGRSRIVRKAYPDPFYASIASEAYPMWFELDVLHETGLLYFGDEESASIQSQLESLRELKIPFSLSRGRDAARFVPGLTLNPKEIGIFTPDAGWVNAEHCVEKCIDIAKSFGANFMQQRIESLDELACEQLVVCAGPWIRELLGENSPPLSTSLQSFFYMKGFRDGAVWIEDSATNVYGFPSEPNARSYKISAHYPDLPIDPNSLQRTSNSELRHSLVQFAQRRFGEAPEVVEEGTCLYTNSPNEDFRVGRLGDRGYFASPCSGHGFKFGPWIGRLLANFVEGKDAPENYPRFCQ